MKALKLVFCLSVLSLTSCGGKDENAGKLTVPSDSQKTSTMNPGNGNISYNNNPSSIFPLLTSANAQILFSQCANIWEVSSMNDVKFKPVISATNGSVSLDGVKEDKFTIVPSGGGECTLHIGSVGDRRSYADRLVVKFEVMDPPKPGIELWVDNSRHNGMSFINYKAECKIKVIPDAFFQKHFPDDAKYVIEKIDLLVQRNSGPPNVAETYSGIGKDVERGVLVEVLHPLVEERPGTRIFFKISGVKRINFQNKEIREPFSESELVISAIIK